jgi:putative peptidoglycan lipid II flippase
VVVQLPAVRVVLGRLRFSVSARSAHVRTVVRSFLPAFVSRGVVQISAYVDEILASLLPSGAVAAMGYAQTLYTLPVSLFGMSVSAAELPAMSSAVGDEATITSYLRDRLNRGLRQIAFFVVPSAAAFATLGHVIASALYQSGRFSQQDAEYVWGILAGSAVGLLASTLGRLYASTYYALRDTRTPLRYAIIRVGLTTGLGYLFAFHLPGLLGWEAKWGAAGLSASAGLAGWVEFLLLRRSLNQRLGRTGLDVRFLSLLWGSAAIAAACGWGIYLLVPVVHPVARAILVLGVYGLVYLLLTHALRIPQAAALAGRFVRRGR